MNALLHRKWMCARRAKVRGQPWACSASAPSSYVAHLRGMSAADIEGACLTDGADGAPGAAGMRGWCVAACRVAAHLWQLRPMAHRLLARLCPAALRVPVCSGVANSGPGSAGSSPRAPASAFAIGVSQDSTQLRATSLAPLSAERAAAANGIA